jgi:hypothetical protein
MQDLSRYFSQLFDSAIFEAAICDLQNSKQESCPEDVVPHPIPSYVEGARSIGGKQVPFRREKQHRRNDRSA